MAGLLALMLLTESRRATREAGGELVPLHEQDRGGWDREMIAEGHDAGPRVPARATSRGSYQLLAAINAVHTDAPTAADTDWCQIATLYDQLYAVDPDARRRAEPGRRGRRAGRAGGRPGDGRPSCR